MLANMMEYSETLDDDVAAIREKVSLFGGLTDPQLTHICGLMDIVNLDAGDNVFFQGQLPCNIYIVLKGEVALEILNEESQELATMKFFQGDCFGESSLIGIQPQLGDAIALCDVKLMALSRDHLLGLVEDDPAVFALLMMNIAREVSRRFHSIMSAEHGAQEYTLMRAH